MLYNSVAMLQPQTHLVRPPPLPQPPRFSVSHRRPTGNTLAHRLAGSTLLSNSLQKVSYVCRLQPKILCWTRTILIDLTLLAREDVEIQTWSGSSCGTLQKSSWMI